MPESWVFRMIPSRRRFLKAALTAPLGARLGGLDSVSASLAGARSAGAAQSLFDNPQIIRYDSSCFTIHGLDTFIFSAALHYPRCPRPLWRDRLFKLKQAGFNTIETYVFWNYHEPEEGHVDLSEFEAFIKLVKEMGFWMIARPGPYVCAEWERGGFPSWVAVRRFPLRSNHVESLLSSRHWFNLVLPVIQKNQVTVGGPILMVQIENEYDFWRATPDAEKKEYIRALAHMAWDAGINVPLMTCWTRQARDNSDPDMAKIMDTCNLYPRWKIMPRVAEDLGKLRREEPSSPCEVTELQGGWFSQVGGKLSVDQDGMSGQQLNMLTKTVIEQGVTSLNYYMAYGGTNFDWAAKNMTTTYDYAAPIREPGGLWEKYYAARGIGSFLSMFGLVLTRAQGLEGATSSHKDVSVTERINGKSGVVFVRENANAEQRYKMTFHDPHSPTKRIISAPREGELVLGAREMKMLPVQFPIAGSQLRYSTAEVLAYGLNLDRHYLIVYDEPGRAAEIALATAQEPQVEGDPLYQYWDSDYESVVIGFRVEKTEKILLVNNHLLVVVVPRDRALRTWTAEFSPKVIPGAEETKPISVPFMTDSYLLAASGDARNRIWADLDFLPGEHNLMLLLPPVPAKCRVDGVLTDFQYHRPTRTVRLSLTTASAPGRAIDVNQARVWVEKFDPGKGDWIKSPARALEELAPVPYGYVRYRAEFNYGGEPKMFISTFADDAKKVFVNGRFVPEASVSKKQAEFPLPRYAKGGTNNLEIAYELFGSPNVGGNLGELKGIEWARLGAEVASASSINAWQIQRFPQPVRGKELDPQFSPASQESVFLGGAPAGEEPLPSFTWCRAEFSLEKPEEIWSVPWRLTFEADRDALLYLNGKFVGRYVTVGPQKDFYLPEPNLVFGAKGRNVLTILLAYTNQAGHIRTLRVAPYEEYSARRTRIEFEW